MADGVVDYTVPFGAVIISIDEYRQLIQKAARLDAAQDRIAVLEHRIDSMNEVVNDGRNQAD